MSCLNARNRVFGITKPKYTLLLTLALTANQVVQASMPVCRLSEPERLKDAALVVQARFISADRRYDKASKRQSLLATYRITEVLKGNVRVGQTIKVYASCLEAPVPEGMMGYPQARRYCGGGIGANITGAGSGTDASSKADAEKPLTLFLDGEGDRGPYTEASRTSFNRSKCR